MDNYVDTTVWPARRVQLTEAQMREHSKRPRKRPYLPQVGSLQGRAPGTPQVSAYGVLGVLVCTVSAVCVVALLVHVVAR